MIVQNVGSDGLADLLTVAEKTLIKQSKLLKRIRKMNFSMFQTKNIVKVSLIGVG